MLAHLADAELVIGYRMRLILASDGTVIPAFDQDAWAQTFNYNRRDSKTSVEIFRMLRENNLKLEIGAPKIVGELRPASRARQRVYGPSGEDDGRARREAHRPDGRDRETSPLIS